MEREGLDVGEWDDVTVTVVEVTLCESMFATGWLYGEFEGNSGSFPEEYTAPIVCVGEKPTEAAILVNLKTSNCSFEL